MGERRRPKLADHTISDEFAHRYDHLAKQRSLAAYPEFVQDENHDFSSGGCGSSFVIGKAVDTDDEG